MHGDYRPLHINEIVFAQQLILSPELAMSVPRQEPERNSSGVSYLR
jgi:hypothetical protein